MTDDADDQPALHGADDEIAERVIDAALAETAEPQQDEPAADPFAGIPAPLADALRQRGFDTLTSVQSAALAAESEGRDLRISSQTGSGKTVAIGLALASHLVEAAARNEDRPAGPSVLVLVPTRELAMQVRDELHWLFAAVRGIGIEVVMGGTSLGQERRALDRRPRVVVGTPGRVLDHLKTGALKSDSVAHVVLDESDRMLDMGFREELEAILEHLPSERRSHLVSATFPWAVRKLADRFQKDPLHIEGTRLGAANLDIEHVAHVVERNEYYAALVNLLLLNEGGRCLIFVERRVDVTKLSERLSSDGFPVQSFSGELPQVQRTRTLSAFRDGTIRTLVSTDVAARGIDVPDIELVIHADPPGNADDYVHRSGRTGRAGRTGRSVLLVSPRGRYAMTRLLSAARIDASWQPAPAARRVRKQLRKRFRQQLHARLATDDALTQQQIDYAKNLLDGRDPAAVVATLLELAQPEPVREPMQVSEPAPDGAPQVTQAKPGFVRFMINWGERAGCQPNRVLGHVCRRGNIRGQDVGEIEVGLSESSFDVDARVASRFEKLVARRDTRDPHLRIVRVDAPRGRSDAAKPGPKGKRRFPGKSRDR